MTFCKRIRTVIKWDSLKCNVRSRRMTRQFNVSKEMADGKFYQNALRSKIVKKGN